MNFKLKTCAILWWEKQQYQHSSYLLLLLEVSEWQAESFKISWTAKKLDFKNFDRNKKLTKKQTALCNYISDYLRT